MSPVERDVIRRKDEINHEQVYTGLHQALELFPKYIEAIEAYLTGLPTDGQSK